VVADRIEDIAILGTLLNLLLFTLLQTCNLHFQWAEIYSGMSQIRPIARTGPLFHA